MKNMKNNDENKFFIGAINGLVLSLPFWVFAIYIIWRW